MPGSVKSMVLGSPLHRMPFEDTDAEALVVALGRGSLHMSIIDAVFAFFGRRA
jgi:hypothetical protein